MANIQSAIKRIRSSRRRQARNLKVKNLVRSALKEALRAVNEKKENALELVKQAIKLVDKAVGSRILKKNTAGRRKSRLMKKAQALKK